MRKTRPCLVVSPDELNDHLRTVIVAPMTTGGQAYPWRVSCRFQGRSGFVATDQLRTVDAERSSEAPWTLGSELPSGRLVHFRGDVCALNYRYLV